MKTIVWDDPIRIGEWVAQRTGGLYTPQDSYAMGLEQNGKIIAGVWFDGYNGASINMHVAAEGKNWMNRKFLQMAFDYPFNKAKVNKIIGLVCSSNLSARRFDEHLGFILEAVVKSATTGGDLLIYTMTRDQCRHLAKEPL